MRKTTILAVLPDLRSGGAQKVMLNIIKQLDQEKFNVYLFVADYSGDFKFNLPKHIKIVQREKMRTRQALFSLIKSIKQVEPDVLFSTLNRTNILTIIACKIINYKGKIIIREPNIPSHQIKNKSLPPYTFALAKLLYKFSDLVIAQTEEMYQDIIKTYSLNEDNVKTIYNPLDFIALDNKHEWDSPFPDNTKLNIVAIGRLSYQKGYDIMLQSFNALFKINNQFRLFILGDMNTTEADKIIALQKELKLDDSVTFLGFKSNPYTYLANAKALILTSRWEGLPNVVLEARYLQIPVVVTNTLEIYQKIIREGRDGYIVDFDPEEISVAIANSIDLKPQKFYYDTINEYEEIFL